MTLYLLTFLLLKSRKEGWFLGTKIGSEWTDTWRIARGYRASPSLGCWQMFLVLTEYRWICFHLESCIEGDGSHQRKVIFRIFLFCVGFLKVEYLKRIFLACVWMVMVQQRCLTRDGAGMWGVHEALTSTPVDFWACSPAQCLAKGQFPKRSLLEARLLTVCSLWIIDARSGQ